VFISDGYVVAVSAERVNLSGGNRGNPPSSADRLGDFRPEALLEGPAHLLFRPLQAA
jgi:hypothetical protein